MSKIVSIHQPQYLPWIPYFDKILQCDSFVFLDTVQFQKNGVQNRNQIKTSQGPIWLTVPVSQSSEQKIIDTKISNKRAIGKHIKTIKLSYSKAPYFDEVFSFLEKTLSSDFDNLSDLNIEIVIKILEYLGYKGDILKSSDFNCSGNGSDLVLNLCKETDATIYLSGQGGKNYMNLDSFKSQNIQVNFQKYQSVEYQQLSTKQGFLPNLSIIDLLFNHGKDSSNDIILEGRQPLEKGFSAEIQI